MATLSLKNMDRVKALAERLKRNPMLVNFARRQSGTSLDEQAWQVATSLADIQQSTERLYGELVPKLLGEELPREEAEDVLNEIGEEYRHILYHIQDTKLFGYIVAQP